MIPIAYIDPGLGALFFQVLGGAVLFLVFSVQLWWRRFTGRVAWLFGRRTKKG